MLHHLKKYKIVCYITFNVYCNSFPEISLNLRNQYIGTLVCYRNSEQWLNKNER